MLAAVSPFSVISFCKSDKRYSSKSYLMLLFPPLQHFVFPVMPTSNTSGDIWHLSFGGWPFVCNVMSSKTSVLQNISEFPSITCSVYFILLVQPPTEGHWVALYRLTAVTNPVMSLYVLKYLFLQPRATSPVAYFAR